MGEREISNGLAGTGSSPLADPIRPAVTRFPCLFVRRRPLKGSLGFRIVFAICPTSSLTAWIKRSTACPPLSIKSLQYRVIIASSPSIDGMQSPPFYSDCVDYYNATFKTPSDGADQTSLRGASA